MLTKLPYIIAVIGLFLLGYCHGKNQSDNSCNKKLLKIEEEKNIINNKTNESVIESKKIIEVNRDLSRDALIDKL